MIETWLAGFVRRWHTNPHLNHTVDRIDGHGARVALIANWLNPDLSKDAILYAITHDYGEAVVGDDPYSFKVANAAVARAKSIIEEDARLALGAGFSYSEEAPYIKIADWLDAWLWAGHHAPWLLQNEDWQAQRANTLREACKHGVEDKVRSILDD